MTLLGAISIVAAVIGSGTFAWIHNEAATADDKTTPNHVVGPAGGLIGSAPNAHIRSQWEREGLPN